MKKTILLLCGGQSGEHQVSLRSALSIIRELPKDQYDLIPVAIDHHGQWWTGDPLIQFPEDPEKIRLASNLKAIQLTGKQVEGRTIDCAFSVLHGRFGEDGCMQGALEMAGIPYIGSGVLGSAMAMDKDITKRLALHEGLKTAPYHLTRDTDPERPTYSDVAEQLGDTLFVKPAAQGSSLGISKATDTLSFEAALDLAFQYDRKVIIEKAMVGREIELAVLGNENPIVSKPGEILVTEEFYSYEAKYILNNTKLEIPASVSSELEARLQEAAIRTYRCLELRGLARIDFFVDEQEEIWLNEPNTLPGFTSISMYSMMFAASGVSYPELVTKLIEFGIESAKRDQRIKQER